MFNYGYTFSYLLACTHAVCTEMRNNDKKKTDKFSEKSNAMTTHQQQLHISPNSINTHEHVFVCEIHLFHYRVACVRCAYETCAI